MDPLTVTASAAGLVSLGLTVSGGLIRYCKAYQGQDADLNQLAIHAKELEIFLCLIENQMANLQGPNQDITNSLQRCRDACDDCLSDFKGLNAKYTYQRPSQTLKERGRRLVHDLRYPFDKGKFDNFRSQLQEFYTRLLGHMQLIHLEMTRNIRSETLSNPTKITLALESVQQHVQSSISSTEQMVTNTVHENTDRLESCFLNGLKQAERDVKISLDRNLSAVSTQVSSLSEVQASQLLIVKAHFDQAFELHHRKILESFIQAQARTFQIGNRTTLVESNAANAGSDQGIRSEKPPNMPAQNIFDSLCTCTTTSREFRNMRHQQGCIYSSSNTKQLEFTIFFRLFNRRVTAKWKLEYHPTGWARSWKIYRNLTIQATVPIDSPAFQTIRRLAYPKMTGSFSRESQIFGIMRDCLVELQQIFANGKGWPTDVTEGGFNLLHMAVICISHERSVSWSDEMKTTVTHFLHTLVKLGVPASEKSGDIRSPLDAALMFLTRFHSDSVHSDSLLPAIADKFLEMDAVMTPSERVIPIQKWPKLYESFECNELCFAVLHHRESDIVRILQRDSSLLKQPVYLGFTPLHLAANLPKGLSILLEHGASEVQSAINIPNSLCRTALSCAMEIGEIQSVEILLDSGAHILHSSLKALISLRDREKAQNIVGILAKTLARRQRELWKFALQNLPTEIVQSLGLDENYPLDDKTFHVVQALKKWRIPVPAVYDTVEPGPVYHLECLSPSWAQVLYDAGFVKTNSPLHGRTPLMCVCDNFWETNFNDMLALINWFQDHGASIYTSLPISGNRRSINRGSGCGLLEVDVPSPTYPTLHYFTESLGFISANEVRTLDRFQTSGKNLFLFSKLLEDKTTDPCHCYCVVNGCTPASKFISGVYTTVLLWEDDITNYVIKYMRSYHVQTDLRAGYGIKRSVNIVWGALEPAVLT